MKNKIHLFFMMLFLTLNETAFNQERTHSKETEYILWYANWESGLKEAKRTQKPILLVSAAPHCRNISGMW